VRAPTPRGDLPSTPPAVIHRPPRTPLQVTPLQPPVPVPAVGTPLRRSMRNHKPREVYDATTGKSAKPGAVDDSI
jgi:hypothetical protein